MYILLLFLLINAAASVSNKPFFALAFNRNKSFFLQRLFEEKSIYCLFFYFILHYKK